VKEVKSRIQYQLAAKEMRDGKRYKQVEIARGSGLSQPMVSRLISSPSLENFTVGSIVLMADWLGCSVDDLIKRDTADDEQ
jgi:transcriptional regulator with XRE-family HTH domain